MQTRHVTRVLIILILVLAVAARFYQIDAHSFWNDEGNSARIAERNVDLIIEGAAGDIHPPLYYLTLYVWRTLFGSSETALRSLSVIFGVITVWAVFLLGRRLFDARIAMLAALIAALNPFQIYYSQEARMYMMLAAIGVVSTYLLVRLLDFWSLRPRIHITHRRYYIIYILTLAAGLYTHYAFPFVIAVHFFIVLAWSLYRPGRLVPQMGHWLALSIAALVMFLPWLPIALRQIGGWPAQAAQVDAGHALQNMMRLYVLGPTAPASNVLGAILIAVFFLIVGTWAPNTFDEPEPDWHATVPRPLRIGAVLIYWLVPIALIFSFGLFTEAYFKFLLVGSPAFCLLLARGIDNAWQIARGTLSTPRELSGQRIWAWSWMALVIILLATILMPTGDALNELYFDPAHARDDYRGIAHTIIKNQREGDAVILHAPNQWEVFTYYFPPAANVIALVDQRPMDQATTEKELSNLLRNYTRLYVVYWGERESDPTRFVERWLDEHTYKAAEEHFGNVRLVRYAIPSEIADYPQSNVDARLGDSIWLDGYSLLTPRIPPGDIIELALFWHTDAPVAERYKVFVHVVNDEGAIVAQTDREPGGDLVPTTIWQPEQPFIDHFGVSISSSVPADDYRITIGMYSYDGVRLEIYQDGVDIGDSLMLANVTVQP